MQVSLKLGYSQPTESVVEHAMSRGLLSRPTALKFSYADWKNFPETQDNDLSKEDKRILKGGAWLGGRLTALRNSFGLPLKDLCEAASTTMSVAYVNAIFMDSQISFDRAYKDAVKKDGFVSPLHHQARIHQVETGQKISQDHLITTSVDSLSHVLYHCYSGQGTVLPDDGELFSLCSRAYSFANIEFVYRSLCLQVWREGYSIKIEGGSPTANPPSKSYASLWPVWDYRRQAHLIQLMHGAGFGFGRIARNIDIKDKFRSHFLQKVISKVRYNGGDWDLSTRNASDSDVETKECMVALLGIEDSSLYNYLDCKINQDEGATLGDVLRGWVVCCSVERGLSQSIKKTRHGTSDIKNFAFSIGVDCLCNAISACTSMTYENAVQVVNFLTVDKVNTNRLFNKGLWDCPLVSVTDKILMVVPVLEIGNIVRAFENWLERADLASDREMKGHDFEEECTTRLLVSLQSADMPLKVSLPEKRVQFQNEQIDLALFVGGKLIIAECKNMITPGDPMERFNHIGKLNDACDQASRKAGVVSQRIDEFMEEFFPHDRHDGTDVVPLVILATPYGSGLSLNNVPIVDLRYLSIILSSRRIEMGRANFGQDSFSNIVDLYPFSPSGAAFVHLLNNVVVQDRYLNSVEFDYQPFPSGNLERPLQLPFTTVGIGDDARDLSRLARR